MSFQDLGSLGEVVGAIAVLATLVYLAIQTRETRIAAEETAKFAGLRATHSIVNLYVEARRTLLDHKDLIAKANSGAELSEPERFALSIIFHDLFYGAAYSFASAASSGSVHSETGDIEYFALLLSNNPSALDEWSRMKHNVAKMGPGFVPEGDAALGLGHPNS